ncbi:hypothetical protein M9Y10_010653 [Tritrichomonas musculus]|uniref:RRM domain-containing protein n=1 Tax=Tritrichomonas musculus TaxID=1915356 RepID=A0ABR2ILE1_9EUKA
MYRHSFWGMSKGELERSRCQTAWMGGIPRNTSKKEIMDFFEDYNPVSCKIIERSTTNRFAFINFMNERDRDNAIEGKKNCLFKGVQVVVNRSFNAYEGPRLGGKERYDDLYDTIKYY